MPEQNFGLPAWSYFTDYGGICFYGIIVEC